MKYWPRQDQANNSLWQGSRQESWEGSEAMKYMTTWTIRPENVKAAIARFRETGGQVPAGVTMIGRWHEMGTGRGVAVVESDDPVAVSKFNIAWSDLLDLTTVAVVDDAQVAAALP